VKIYFMRIPGHTAPVLEETRAFGSGDFVTVRRFPLISAANDGHGCMTPQMPHGSEHGGWHIQLPTSV
jgi:hypothetical protein